VDICQLVLNSLGEVDDDEWLRIMDNVDDAGLFLHHTMTEEASASGRAVVEGQAMDAERRAVQWKEGQRKECYRRWRYALMGIHHE
jgi:hypothetical protein